MSSMTYQPLFAVQCSALLSLLWSRTVYLKVAVLFRELLLSKLLSILEEKINFVILRTVVFLVAEKILNHK